MILKILILILVLATWIPGFAYADTDDSIVPKPIISSSIYGAAVGLIVGLAVDHGGLGTFRIMSLGFYGGILLGIYRVHRDNSTPSEPVSQIREPGFSLTFNF